MKINFIDLQAQYLEYQEEIDSEVLEVFSTAQFIGGEKLNSLENHNYLPNADLFWKELPKWAQWSLNYHNICLSMRSEYRGHLLPSE